MGEKVVDLFSMYLGDIMIVIINFVGVFVLSIFCGFDSKGLLIGL